VSRRWSCGAAQCTASAPPSARSLQRLPHRLGVTTVALAEALTGPAVTVPLDGFVEAVDRDALAMETEAGLAQVRRHFRPVHGPACRELLHAGAGLVRGDELMCLLGIQAALRLPLPNRRTLTTVRRACHEGPAERRRGG
jgi:hypothetical protein